jgi:hypothetical protein
VFITIEVIIDLQCKKYYEQAPQHAQVDLIFYRNKKVINFRQCIDDDCVKTKVYQPLIFGKVSQLQNIQMSYFYGFQLNVNVSRYMKCTRLWFLIKSISLVFSLAALLFRYACQVSQFVVSRMKISDQSKKIKINKKIQLITKTLCNL